jgi:hypothetical protein
VDLFDSQEKDQKAADGQLNQPDDHTLVLTEPVPQEPVVLPHRRQEDGQSLIQTIVMIIGGIILVILLVLFARWVYHKAHHSDTAPTVGTSQLPQQSSTGQSQSALNQQLNNQSSSGSGNSQPSTGTNQNGKAITNTGPGNVAAIFAGSTLAAAGLHYIISLRRFNQRGY